MISHTHTHTNIHARARTCTRTHIHKERAQQLKTYNTHDKISPGKLKIKQINDYITTQLKEHTAPLTDLCNSMSRLSIWWIVLLKSFCSSSASPSATCFSSSFFLFSCCTHTIHTGIKYTVHTNIKDTIHTGKEDTILTGINDQ